MPTTGALRYIRRDGYLLLQIKAEGRFGGGLWNAPGGRLPDLQQVLSHELESIAEPAVCCH